MRACWIIPLLLPLLSPGTLPARAADEGAGAEKRVTLNLKDVPFRNALELLFAGTGLEFSVDPNVPNPPITLSVRDRTLAQALPLLVDAAARQARGITFGRRGAVYAISFKGGAER